MEKAYIGEGGMVFESEQEGLQEEASAKSDLELAAELQAKDEFERGVIKSDEYSDDSMEDAIRNRVLEIMDEDTMEDMEDIEDGTSLPSDSMQDGTNFSKN